VALGVIAAAALVAMVFWELRQKAPVIDLHLLKNRNFALSTAIMFMLGATLYGSTVLLPLLLQTLMGYTAMQSGMVISPGGFAVVILMPFIGFLLSRYEARWLIVVGILLCASGLFHMSHFNLQIDFRTALIARTIQASGLAFLFVPINTAAFYFIRREKTNNAAGFINLARNIGGSTGIAFVATLLARRAQFHQNVLVAHLTPYDETYRVMLQNATQMLQAKGASAPVAAQQAQGLAYGMLQRQANMLAFNDGFWLMAIAFLCLIPLVLLLKRTRPGKGPVAAH